MTTQTPPKPMQPPKPYGPVAPPPAAAPPLEAPTARGHYLLIDDGPQRRTVRLERDITHVGRDQSADIRLDDHRVSRDHAVLVRHGRHFRLLDNQSANGTFVNDRQIDTATLEDRDVILVGAVAMQYRAID